jgi:hypothetical protein
MICVLCHSTAVNVDVHNLAHGKNMKGLVTSTNDQNIKFLKKKFKITFSRIYKMGVVHLDDQSR